MRENEQRRKLVEYLKKNLSKGYTLESLKWALIKQGYSRLLVEKSIQQFNKELAEKAPLLKTKPAIDYEVVGDNDKPIKFKKPWWKRFFGLN